MPDFDPEKLRDLVEGPSPSFLQFMSEAQQRGQPLGSTLPTPDLAAITRAMNSMAVGAPTGQPDVVLAPPPASVGVSPDPTAIVKAANPAAGPAVPGVSRQPELEDPAFWAANFQRNQPYVVPGDHTYNTPLDPTQETAFRQWLTANKVPFQPEAPVSDYDMRGFWQALQAGNPIAKSAVDPNDQRLHYPDYWKTPYSPTFSTNSQWADPQLAPRWQGDQYTLPNGQVLWDDRAQRWVGPNPPWGVDAITSLMMQQRGVDPVIQALMRGQ